MISVHLGFLVWNSFPAATAHLVTRPTCRNTLSSMETSGTVICRSQQLSGAVGQSTVNIGEPVGGDTFFFPRVSKIENNFHLQKSDDFRENCHICTIIYEYTCIVYIYIHIIYKTFPTFILDWLVSSSICFEVNQSKRRMHCMLVCWCTLGICSTGRKHAGNV